MKQISYPNFTERGLEKRKACDLCHLRKIKCDARQPECSHCTLYKARCRYTPYIRRQRKYIRPEYRNSETPLSDTVIDSNSAFLRGLSLSTDYLVMLDDYFARFNNIIPLFNEKRFRAALQGWNRYPDKRSPIEWASINVILALSLQYRATSLVLPDPDSLELFIRNVRSAMGDIVSQPEDLQHVQVLLGLALIFQTKCDIQSSSMFLATAIKLSHRMGLYRKPNRGSMDDESTSERAGVFWILYVLDREISIKAREPYLHRDSDIEIELPGGANLDDPVGVILHQQNRLWFNIFQARVYLARVQGSIYDWTYSIHAATLSAEEKQMREQSLSKALRDWQCSIPDGFRYDNLDSTLPTYVTRHLLVLHFAFFHSMFKAHKVYFDDPNWIGRLTEYSDMYATGYRDMIMDMHCSTSSSTNTIRARNPFLLPRGWDYLMKISRACIILFRQIKQDDKALFRTAFCTYMTAMIIIIGNNLTFTEHEMHGSYQQDKELASEGLGSIEKAATLTFNTRLLEIHAACAELNNRASISVALYSLPTFQYSTSTSDIDNSSCVI